MARNLSLAELTALYANKAKNPKALFEADAKSSLATVLPGSSTADKLNKLYFTRQNGLLPQRPAVWKSDKEHNTIAICLVIVDTLFHEEIWRQWVEQGERSESAYKAQLFIHAKFPQLVTSPWVQQRLIDHTFQPNWNSVEVVQSLLSVLDMALQYVSLTSSCTDPNVKSNMNTASAQVGACGRLVLATESCLPLYDLQTTGEMLYNEDCSWLKAYHTPQGSWEAGACFRSVDPDIVPPKAVWKSLPGWIMLNRLQAMEIVTLTKLLGGWGQPMVSSTNNGGSGSSSYKDVVIGKGVAYTYLSDALCVNSYKGTVGFKWKDTVGSSDISKPFDVKESEDNINKVPTDIVTVGTVAEENTSVKPTVVTGGDTIINATTSSTSTAPLAATSTDTPVVVVVASQPTLLAAWGAGGTWHEHNGSVFAPEEVFFPTVLSLLGYLRDTTTATTSTGSNDTTAAGVKIAAVTFAEWAKKGDANPIAYDYLDAQLLKRMRATGAVFGRKFSAHSVSVDDWARIVENGGASNNTRAYSSHASRGSPYGRDYSNNDRHYNHNDNYRVDSRQYHSYHNKRSYNDTDRDKDSAYRDNQGNSSKRSYDNRNHDNRSNDDRRYDNRNEREYPDHKRRKY